MYVFAGMLTAMSMFFEYELVKRLAFAKFILVKCHPIVGLVFSCALSVFLGAIFGAEGLTVMFAGITSTVLMQPIYKMMKAKTWDPTVGGARMVARLILFPLRILGYAVKGLGKVTAKLDRQ